MTFEERLADFSRRGIDVRVVRVVRNTLHSNPSPGGVQTGFPDVLADERVRALEDLVWLAYMGVAPYDSHNAPGPEEVHALSA